jgi:general nucleoside transport system permease protein
MLVYVANLGMDYVVRGPWRDPQGLNFPTAFDPAASVPTLLEGTGRLHPGSIIALIVVIALSARSTSVRMAITTKR